MSVFNPQCKRMQRILLFTAASLLAATAAAGPLCLERTNYSTPTSRFVLSDAGDLVTDTVTGLIWQRCLLGQIFDNGDTPSLPYDDACAEAPGTLRNYSAALQATVAYNDRQAQAGLLIGWRVPNRKELATIEELKCVFPALNAVIFPGVPPRASLWSSSRVIEANSNSVWALNAWDGGLVTAVETATLYVRLVRDPG